MNLRTSLVAIIVCVVLGLSAGVLWSHRDTSQWIPDSIQALPDGSAIAIAHSDAERYWQREFVVMRIARDGKTMWRSTLPGRAQSRAAYDGVLANGEVVAVHYAIDVDGDYAHLAGFSLADGRRLWDTSLKASGGVEELGATSGLPFADHFVAAGAIDKRTMALWAIDASTGRVQWTTRIDRPDTMVSVGHQLVVDSDRSDVFVDSTTGATTKHERWGRSPGCARGGDYTQIVESASGPQLVAIASSDPTRETVIADHTNELFAGDDASFMPYRCGHYGDKMVWLGEVFPHHGDAYANHVVVLDANGRVLHDLPAGRGFLHDRGWIAERYPQAASFAGELTRFVPFVSREGDHESFAMYDLEAGTVAWRMPGAKGDYSLSSTELFRVGSHWYWVSPQDHRIDVFDGATGQLTAAVKVDHWERTSDVAPYHVGGGTLWLLDGEYSSRSRLRFAALDAITLRPSFARDINVVDVTAEERAKLAAADSQKPLTTN